MSKAMVVLSGGQDSATCMAWATTMFDEVKAICFNYGQRHVKEIVAAHKICELFDVDLTVKDIPVLAGNPASALTVGGNLSELDSSSGLPKSFVPGRNLIFLTSAASLAMSQGISSLVTGVCQTDFSGYPDCRRSTIDALEAAINLGMEGAGKVQIHTPLMYLTKAETVWLAARLPKGLDAVGLSWTCYEGGERPCGECPACKLRIEGFKRAGLVDPAL